jgi:hypothetical protein
MKLLYTFIFLCITALILYVSAKSQKLQIEQIRGGRRGIVGTFLLSVASLFLTFLQFLVLTGVFPFYLILGLIGAYVLATVINLLIGAIAGFSLPEKRNKIGALTVIWGAQKPMLGCGFIVLCLVILLVSWVGSLWVFWRYPIGSPYARVLVALLQFTLPQLIMIPSTLALAWPTVTSEYLDDDLRNSYLTTSFTGIIYSTIYLLFPIWIFKEEVTSVLGWALPPFWVLLSIPILLFLLGGAFPFFIGMYRFRSQHRIMLDWRRNWLEEVTPLCKLPEGEIRSAEIERKAQELDEEIRERYLSADKMFHFYQDLKLSDVPNEERPLPVSDLGLQESILDIIRKNESQLVNWDIRFGHLDELLHLRNIIGAGKSQDLGGFIEAKLKGIGAEKPQKNVIAGSILSALSAGLVWLFKTYQTEIIAWVGKLVHLTN